MEPTYSPGDKLFVSKFVYRFRVPRAGDVVVLHDPRTGRLVLKRIERIEGKKYFVAGDNPGESTDSRRFGAVPRDSIIGKVSYKYYPFFK